MKRLSYLLIQGCAKAVQPSGHTGYVSRRGCPLLSHRRGVHQRMIFTRLRPEVPFYRALSPRWAYQPESGAGAAAVGGRFNRPGVDTRHLAETAAGILYRSIRDPAERCLALSPEFADQFSAVVYDRDGALPRNADSWTRSR